MTARLLLVFLALVASPSLAKRKPSDIFKLCKRGDPNLSACVKKGMIHATPQLIKDIPELKWPPIDPLYISEIAMNQGQGNFKLTFIMFNLTVTGLKDFQLENVITNNDLTWLNFTGKTARIYMDGEYTMDGQLLVLPVKGTGHVTIDFENVTTDGFINFEYVEKNGKTYLRCKSFKWKIQPTNARSNFTNLFNGDKTLGDSTNKFFNDNWKETFDTYKQLPEEAFGQVFKEFTDRGFSQFPAKDWFLD